MMNKATSKVPLSPETPAKASNASPNQETPAKSSKAPLSPEMLAKMNAYWRAANYLSVGQIYLKDDPLLERPLTLDDVKPRLLGHWGTTPGLNFLYVHWNRLIRERDLDMLYIIGPGHGGPGLVANTYLEGSYSEIYPHIEQNRDGIKRLFRQFSWPYGIPSHVAPETPGSIHEGGELGYSLVHAYGAAFDNPNLIVACVVGDGEAETGPLATSWHSNKFLNPATDGAVLPILHLNGYKIANPTVLARIPHAELEELMRGYGYEPFTLEGDDPETMHQQAAAVFDTMLDRIAAIQKEAREAAAKGETLQRPAWPMLIMRTPKGWTGPKFVDGKPVEGTWRAPGAVFRDSREARPSAPAGRVDAQLQARGTLRRERRIPRRSGRNCSQGTAAHGHERPLQRRPAAGAPEDSQLPRFCGQDRRPRPAGCRIHARSRPTPARGDGSQQGREELPRLRPRRNGFKPAGRRNYRNRQDLDVLDPAGGRESLADRPGDGNPE
jgi:phosphoketolase